MVKVVGWWYLVGLFAGEGNGLFDSYGCEGG